jgi:uncharacterized membrane-anchored protein
MGFFLSSCIFGLDPETLAGAATPVVFALVWIFLRRLRRKRLRHAHA